MSQKIVFEELDDATREYLTAVRAAEGVGSPGVFAPTKSSMAGCGCIAGPIIIIATLLFTLTTWIDVIYDDPVRVALLQTAGLLLGGWLLVAGIRSSAAKRSSKMAGHWVYVDPLHLYEAYREQVTITRIDDAVEANFTHNYNNGAYQNSVIRVLLSGNNVAEVTLNNEQRAEQMVVYMNYLAWARGEGGDRASLPPVSLGGLAKYVAKNDAEPKDAEGNINLNLVELDITEVPEEPTREGRSMPAFLPYIFILLGAIGLFGLMAYIVNPRFRDDAIYNAVMKSTNPPSIEPRFLRVYLIDPRNTRHRAEVQTKLGEFYDQVIGRLPPNVGDQDLRDGMIKIFRSLKEADQPIVSLRVEELVKQGPKDPAQERVKKLKEELVGRMTVNADGSVTVGQEGILGELARIMPPIPDRPPDVIYNPKPPPIGVQLIDFASMPEDATHAHFEIVYQFVASKGNPKLYELTARVELRTSLDADPVAVYTEDGGRLFTADKFNFELERFRDRLLLGLVGKPAVPGK